MLASRKISAAMEKPMAVMPSARKLRSAR